MRIFTVGHSTRSLDELVDLMRHYGIGRVVDIRTIPRSRHNPQFNRDTLAQSLHNRRIGYRHLKELGGLHHPRPDSINDGWHNDSFRGYADYMQTPQFTAAVETLIALAKEKVSVIMCAETLPWRCHRSLVGDALLIRDIEVWDIFTKESLKPHLLTPMAQVTGTLITYPAPKENWEEHHEHHP